VALVVERAGADDAHVARAAPTARAKMISTADRTGQDRRRLIRIPGAAANKPAWSPSRQRIAFTVDHDPPSGVQIEIYVARADGTGVRRLTGGPAKTVDTGCVVTGRPPAAPAHAEPLRLQSCLVSERQEGRALALRLALRHQRRRKPSAQADKATDGLGGRAAGGRRRLIAFVRADRDDLASLYVIRRDGTSERALTDGGDERSPTWSPDSRLVPFASLTKIKTAVPRTRQARMLIAMPGSELTSPAWQR
jgi:Tol biopolymer transport system component